MLSWLLAEDSGTMCSYQCPKSVKSHKDRNIHTEGLKDLSRALKREREPKQKIKTWRWSNFYHNQMSTYKKKSLFKINYMMHA